MPELATAREDALRHPLLGRRVGAVIAGEETLVGGPTVAVTDPSTGLQIGEVEVRSSVPAAIEAALGSLGPWWARPASERGRILQVIAAAIRSHAETLALLEAIDAGLPLTAARRDIETAARYFEFYAGAADKFVGDTLPLGGDVVDYTVREPWGVCAIVQPFNFPCQLFARSVGPALATGNTVVLKSADAAPLCAVALALMAADVGLPAGTLNVVHGGAEVGAELVEHPRVDHVTFTGSSATGQRIMEACARHARPLTLELGGKSAQMVLDEKYLRPAAKAICASLFATSGQACSAGSRLLVGAGLAEEMQEAVVEEAAALRVGDALADLDLGPLISERQLGQALDAVEGAVAAGATLSLGGRRLEDDGREGGYFIGPTVLGDVDHDLAIAHEEVFAPVLTVTEVADADEALALANDSEYGLAGGIWTGDISTALRLAGGLRVGQVFVNGYGGGVELPFGGYKRSGFGREKGLEALNEYTQVKNVCIRLA